MAKEKFVQTTLRVERETLYKARYVLNLQGLSVAKFLVQKLEEVARDSKHVHDFPSVKLACQGEGESEDAEN